MTQKETRGETHGCIVCGRPYQLYVVYEQGGKYFDAKVMTAGGRIVQHAERALVACESHTDDEVQRAVRRVYGSARDEDD